MSYSSAYTEHYQQQQTSGEVDLLGPGGRLQTGIGSHLRDPPVGHHGTETGPVPPTVEDTPVAEDRCRHCPHLHPSIFGIRSTSQTRATT